MSERDCSFCGTMRRLVSDERERADFNRRMAGFCKRTDKELLEDIRSECHGVSHAERHECLKEMEGLREFREFDNQEMRRRVREVNDTLNVSDPPDPPPIRRRRRRRSSFLRPLIALFLLRGIL